MTNTVSNSKRAMQLALTARAAEFMYDKDPLEKMKGYTKKNAPSNLTDSARNYISHYIDKNTRVKDNEDKIEKLTSFLVTLKKNNDAELYDSTKKELLSVMKEQKTLLSLVENKNAVNNKMSPEEFNNIINNNTEIKELRKRVTQIELEYRNTNPNSILARLFKLRKQIIDFDIDTTISFDELIHDDKPTDKSFVVIEHQRICQYIADELLEGEFIVDELIDMQRNVLLNYLKNSNYVTVKCNHLSKEIDKAKYDLNQKISEITNQESISSILFDKYNMKNNEKNVIICEEILTATSVATVKSLAISRCYKLNQMHNYEDAISAGLVGLSVAIKKWVSIQKEKETPVSFGSFKMPYIVNYIKRGLLELSHGGMASGSTVATLQHKRNKQLEIFITHNPDFKNLPTEVVENLMDMSDVTVKVPSNVISESKYKNIVGGDDATQDIWSNSIVDHNSEQLIDARNEYEQLIKSIRSIFDLFEIKKSGTNFVENSNRKMFDKYDFKLFKLCFGLEFKRENINSNDPVVNNNYSQLEIAKLMERYYAVDHIKVTFTQSAISNRFKSILKKFRLIMDAKPEIKKAFEYFYAYWQANTDLMNYISNTREEINLKMDVDSIRELYADNDKVMNTNLSNGQRLVDAYISDNNYVIEDEIAKAFRTF